MLINVFLFDKLTGWYLTKKKYYLRKFYFSLYNSYLCMDQIFSKMTVIDREKY